MSGPDMGRAAVALRCFADFLAARPALPAAVSLDVSWSGLVRAWVVRVHLFDITAKDLAAWAVALDDAVTTTEPGVGTLARVNVRGSVHGHPVHVWSFLDRTRGGDR